MHVNYSLTYLIIRLDIQHQRRSRLILFRHFTVLQTKISQLLQINFIHPPQKPTAMSFLQQSNLQGKFSSYHSPATSTRQEYSSENDTKNTSISNQVSNSSSYKASQLLNYASPFSPYMELSRNSSATDSTTDQDDIVTDRFIPSRKLLKKQSLYSDGQMVDENVDTTGTANESSNSASSMQVADMYRKYFISESSNTSSKQKDILSNIQTYQNNNIFKYSNKSLQQSLLETPILKKSSASFDFTADDLFTSNTSVQKRKINKLPCKVLDAPALQDDYYLNLIDWSSQNYLAVGLASSVYMWNANNSKVTKLCDLGMSDSATSVSWSTKGPMFALGTNTGEVQIWDVNKMKRVRILHGHTNRVGAISWSSNMLSTGSRDKTILHRDIRSNTPFTSKLIGHKQQICGLKWSFDEQQLCSGGNDNKLLVWNPHSTEPILKFNDHTAAVKAMAWSPHQHGLLASGGGTADRTIRFRNTLNGSTVKTLDAGSQVCNLIFSKSLNELVSTHGYSQNEINVWKYPKMEKIATLTGHTYRVLYLAMSPDGSTIVTGAGDQTLRFWNIFPNKNQSGKKSNSLLNIDNVMIR